jgi:membrane protease YdiL (CAAX protease family)
VSAALSLGTLGTSRLPYPYAYATEISASAPLFAFSDEQALAIGGVQIGEVGATRALHEATRSNTDFAPYWGLASTFSFHQSMYAAYATYREGRVRGASPAWNDGWRPWTAQELIVSPVQWHNVNHPIVLWSVGLETLALAGLTALDFSPTPLRAGPTVRDIGLGVLTSIDAGVTEEALFRGFFYEELKQSLPRLAAHLIDMSAFALAHVPGELEAGANTFALAESTAARFAISYVLERAYDEGGLVESVPLHALWDIVAETTDVLRGGSTFGAVARVSGAQPTHGRAATPFVVPILSGRF